MNLGGAPESLSAVTCWNTPVIGTPHFFCSVGATQSGIELTVDFRPRVDAAYDTMLEDGSYPEPTDRDMFMQGSLRKELADAYFTSDAESWCASVRAAAGAQTKPRGMPAGCAGPRPNGTSSRPPAAPMSILTHSI